MLEQKLHIILFKNNFLTTVHTLPIAATKPFSVPMSFFFFFCKSEIICYLFFSDLFQLANGFEVHIHCHKW